MGLIMRALGDSAGSQEPLSLASPPVCPCDKHFALLVHWAAWYSLLGGTQDAFYIKEQSVDHIEALR